jgi:hypothetical protein
MTTCLACLQVHAVRPAACHAVHRRRPFLLRHAPAPAPGLLAVALPVACIHGVSGAQSVMGSWLCTPYGVCNGVGGSVVYWVDHGLPEVQSQSTCGYRDVPAWCATDAVNVFRL